MRLCSGERSTQLVRSVRVEWAHNPGNSRAIGARQVPGLSRSRRRRRDGQGGTGAATRSTRSDPSGCALSAPEDKMEGEVQVRFCRICSYTSYILQSGKRGMPPSRAGRGSAERKDGGMGVLAPPSLPWFFGSLASCGGFCGVLGFGAEETPPLPPSLPLETASGASGVCGARRVMATAKRKSLD